MRHAQEAKEAAAAAAKALEEEDKQKAEEAARKAEELAAVQREMDEKKAKDRAMLEVSRSCSVPALQLAAQYSTNMLCHHEHHMACCSDATRAYLKLASSQLRHVHGWDVSAAVSNEDSRERMHFLSRL